MIATASTPDMVLDPPKVQPLLNGVKSKRLHTDALQASDLETLDNATYVSYEEFLACTEEHIHAEWVNGEIIKFMPPKRAHQTLVEFLYFVIQAFLNVYNHGELKTAPFEVKLSPEGNAREPDLLFVANLHLDRLTDDRVIGAPDLVVEVISSDSVHRDRVDKFDEYEAGGIPEYWLIDNRPNRNRAQFYQLDENGVYQEVPVGRNGIYRSRAIPGFWLRVSWLWERKPNMLRALAAIIGPAQLAAALEREAEVESEI